MQKITASIFCAAVLVCSAPLASSPASADLLPVHIGIGDGGHRGAPGRSLPLGFRFWGLVTAQFGYLSVVVKQTDKI
jgi:hypothetical protein